MRPPSCRPHSAQTLSTSKSSPGLPIRSPWTSSRGFSPKLWTRSQPSAVSADRSTWTLALAAEVCAEHGITAEPVSYETIRDALKRLGVGWRRAKTWITSPDPQYALKKTGVTA